MIKLPNMIKNVTDVYFAVQISSPSPITAQLPGTNLDQYNGPGIELSQ